MLTYKDSGVDKEAGYREVQLIKQFIKSTYTEGVASDIGGFAGLFRPNFKDMEDPILVSGTDGVGTKVQLAFMSDVHNTVGIDAVAMCVNDILCQGARPLFFLDYIATGKLVPEKMASIVEGVAEGCVQAGAALIGGETAEMPGIYQENHYDLAGFTVGIVDSKRMITGEAVKVGDVLIGLKSSGVHSNGFSLVRRIIFDKMNFSLDDYIEEFDSTLGEELLKPTRIYVKLVLDLLEKFKINAISHITGGGIFENLPRVLKEGQGAVWDLSNYEAPAVFKMLSQWGNVPMEEMYNTFNMGVGMVLVVDPSEAVKLKDYLSGIGEDYVEMGHIVKGSGVQLWNLKK